MKILNIAILLFCHFAVTLSSQETTRSFYTDDEGVIRRGNDDKEVHGFGVNYSVPFAHAYRIAERMGISHKEAMRQDIYHMARLDLDLYRVHVWDTEISDSAGNLLENEHLELFDFAIHEMKKRGMKFIITPIAFWGNGWPEPDEDTPGFSNKYGKEACLTNPNAIAAQENYLEQFMEHVNPYTGLAYKNDPDVIAVEVSNEPHHEGPVEKVRKFINGMVEAIRKTGTNKPVFYNMSHSTHLAQAYLDSDVNGGTFQWYPTGLVAEHGHQGNYLPHVDDYPIPFADHPDFKDKAKIVYEFDPADVDGNYMYPAMARTFREAGMQLATHFDYDAMFLAPYNTNYGTHFMSLPYAPQKALSLKIASAVFHEIPRNQAYGRYPGNTEFGNFRIDYKKDLSELIAEKRFFYSNTTASEPPAPQELTEIAGYGNSPVVSYDGKGAYFLDKLEEGVWRLEVMPDANRLGDPYAPVSLDRQIAAVAWRSREMELRLPGLKDNFRYQGINPGNAFSGKAKAGTFQVKPGVYLLQAEDVDTGINSDTPFKNIKVGEFVAPEPDLDTVIVDNRSVPSTTEGESAQLSFEVVSPANPEEVKIYTGQGRNVKEYEASYKVRDVYGVALPDSLLQHGILHYQVAVRTDGKWRTFPSGIRGRPGEWDFYARQYYSLDVLPTEAPVLLWQASDYDKAVSTWMSGVDIVPSYNGKKLHYRIPADSLKPDKESPLHAFKYYFGDQTAGRGLALKSKDTLAVRINNEGDHVPELAISLIDRNGTVQTITISPRKNKELYKIPVGEMKTGRQSIVPRPYPAFFPFYAAPPSDGSFDLSEAEMIQVVLKGPVERNKPFIFSLHEIWLE